MDTITERIRWLRDAGGLDKKTLSLLAGLSQNTVHQIESKLIKNPSLQSIAAIARVTGATLDWLATGKGDKPSMRRVRAAVALAREVQRDS